MLPKRCMTDVCRHAVLTEVYVFCPHCQAIKSEMIQIQTFRFGRALNIILGAVAAENQVIEADNPRQNSRIRLFCFVLFLFRLHNNNVCVFEQEFLERYMVRWQSDLLCKESRCSEVNAV